MKDRQEDILMEVKDICKNFGVTVALDHVSFQIRRGEIKGLIGENGSGKSTVSSIIAGMQKPDAGQMTYQGKAWKPGSMLEAGAGGIGMIVQEAGTVARISVAENLFLGAYGQFKKGALIRRKAMITAAEEALRRIGADHVRADMPTALLDMQERKLVEIAKCVALEPEILIVDETTTALSQEGRDILYGIIHKMAEEGKAVLIISHDIAELMEHCTTLTILRDGKIIDHLEREDFEENRIKSLMVGRKIEGDYYRADRDGTYGETVLEARNITTLQDLAGFNLKLHKGEILGIGGLSHCGMHTVGRALYGLEEVLDGEVVLQKNGVRLRNAKTAFENGMGYISKNRDTESLELAASIGANIASTGYRINRIRGGLISGKRERRYVERQIEELKIKCVDQYQIVNRLSGGNKQKVVFGKWMACGADILIMDCPTRGVDVGVKAAMYHLIEEMKKDGKSIVLISEELPELMGMSDRLLIMKDGKVEKEFMRGDGYDDKEIIRYMI